MLKDLLLKAAIFSIPLVAAADPIPRQVTCRGTEENLKANLEVFYSPNPADFINSLFIVVEEQLNDQKIMRLYDRRDLIISAVAPLFVKSATSEPEFFIDMANPDAEFQGIYYTRSVKTKEDLQIGIKCSPVSAP